MVFILCGSASSWIEENILSSTGFVGRISHVLTLEQLTLRECNQFWPKKISAYEKFKILAITGGVPKYLEEVNFNESAEVNISRLCFNNGGFMVEEFDRIFSDLFLRDSNMYRKIVTFLASGAKDRMEICGLLNIEPGGRISEYLAELELSGFITKDYVWSIPTGKEQTKANYRLSDNYLRFYLKYIVKNRNRIKKNIFKFNSLNSLPEWEIVMGLQFENLVLLNRDFIYSKLNIKPNEIINDNPYFQKKTKLYQGCQIDYLIQTRFNTIYVCEIKFSKNKIDSRIIHEIEKKITALNYPSGFSCRPVLIHVNGVTKDLLESDFFADIIDMNDAISHS